MRGTIIFAAIMAASCILTTAHGYQSSEPVSGSISPITVIDADAILELETEGDPRADIFHFIVWADQSDLGELAVASFLIWESDTGTIPLVADTTGRAFDRDSELLLGLHLLAHALETGEAGLAARLTPWLESNLPTIEQITAQSACAEFALPPDTMWGDLERADQCRFASEERHWANLRGQFDFLREYQNRLLSADESFEMFIMGGPDFAPPYQLQPGWMGDRFYGREFPALARLKRDYLVSHDMHALAEEQANPLYCDQPPRFAEALPKLLDLHQAELPIAPSDFVSAAASRCVPRPDFRAMRTEFDPSALPNERPAYFRERPLAEALPAEAGGSELPDMPSADFRAVRTSFSEGEWTAIFISRAIDPGGEVSAGGYWITRTENGGASWGEEYYLGLQPNFPYVVVSDSDIPLVTDGHLQIEVEIQEIDRSTITFPPIGMRLAREESGLFLDFLWEDLIRDQDGDGLTDIFEHRIGLDYTAFDMDGDGLRDSFDPLPTAAFDPEAEDRADFFAVMLQPILGADAGALLVPPRPIGDDELDLEAMMAAIGSSENRPASRAEMLLISGDPQAFSNLRWSRIPFVIHREDVYRALSAEYGPTYPVRFSVIQPNDSETAWYVEWDASWVGGTFLVREVDGIYELRTMSSWIT
jgi:hypothetical protein